jgi:hypothetical protein
MWSRHREAIAWNIVDIKCIDSTLYMQHIYTEDYIKPFRDMQRHLNPNMKEVVKKEILKWLDAGIIYPIVDSNGLVLSMWCQRRQALLWKLMTKENKW